MNWKLYLLIGSVVVVLVGIFLYTTGGQISGFQSGGSVGPSFTMYYADWCPHCQAAKPGFKGWIDESGGSVQIGSQRCKINMVTPEQDPDAVKGKGVKGFPTFLLETADGKQVEYQGERNKDSYLAFLNQKLGGGI
jgi:thiol-disulfide isomerase/thioredoxin